MEWLDSILSYKKEEIKARKNWISLDRIKRYSFLKTRNFSKIFKQGKLAFIAEIKRASPSAGVIVKNLDPLVIARIYEDNGADAISIVTDRKFFGGSFEYIKKVKEVVKLPILAKDFIIDEYQIFYYRLVGADAVLLIARILDNEKLSQFITLTYKLGFSCIVEVHNQSELKRALKTKAKIIGINNRDLNSFKVNLANSFALVKKIPTGIITVSESGIKNIRDVQRLKKEGFNGILVGEVLLRSRNITAEVRKLRGQCGQSQ